MPTDIGICLNLGIGRSASPYAGYALALDFKNQQYWASGTKYAALSSVPGYAYADAVDNVPNIGANGYSNDTNSDFHVTSPITVEQDFILWAIVNWGAAAGGNEWAASISNATATEIMALLRNATGTLSAFTAHGGSNVNPLSGKSATTGRTAFLLRRRGTLTTAAAKAADLSVSVSAESTVITFPTITALYIGGFAAASGLVPSTSFIEGVFVQTGTFSDAQLTALLTAA
jgi:hypothetical protein